MSNIFFHKTKSSKLIFLIFCLSLFSSTIKAQSNVEKLYGEAKSSYTNGEYEKAIEICKKIVVIDDENVNTHLIMAYSFEELDSVNAEIYHLKKALEITEVPEANYWLGEAYFKLERFSEALYYYNRYKDYKYITAKRKLIMACKIASGTFSIQSLKNISTDNFDDENSSEQYWPVQGVNRSTLVFNKYENEENESFYEDSFISNVDSTEAITAKNLNTNNTSQLENSYTEPQIVFFSACDRTDGFGKCDIYFSRNVDGIWSEPANAGSSINTEYLEAQPTFSVENGILYFSSNRPGGMGEKDIWQTQLIEFTEEGLPVWGTTKNVAEINSVGNEISPFVDSKKQKLYFASDSRVGMGGFDLFQSAVEKNGAVKNIKNLGHPINTNADELGLLITYMHDTAYFTSARAKNEGLEIFAFNLTRGLSTSPSSYLKIKLINKKTKQAIQAEIELVDLISRTDETVLDRTNEEGEKILCVRTNRNYTLNIVANGFMYYSKEVFERSVNSLEEAAVLNIELNPIELGAEVDLYSIYYETNSYAILPTSEPELDRLISFLTENTALKVEIQGHTDSTGDTDSNLLLSEQRAKSVINYLVKNKINISRLKHIGYGDKVPIASNETEEGRTLNRRTTIKITAL